MMKQLYLIRHGDADYENDRLTDEGRDNVRGLSRSISGLLPQGIKCSIVSSPSGRAKETAQLLLPMLREKSGAMANIHEEPRLSEIRSMGTVDEMKRFGEQNLALLEQYNSDHGIFTPHERIIRAMAFAISDKFRISLPDAFYPGKAYRRLLVNQIMREHNC